MYIKITANWVSSSRIYGFNFPNICISKLNSYHCRLLISWHTKKQLCFMRLFMISKRVHQVVIKSDESSSFTIELNIHFYIGFRPHFPPRLPPFPLPFNCLCYKANNVYIIYDCNHRNWNVLFWLLAAIYLYPFGVACVRACASYAWCWYKRNGSKLWIINSKFMWAVAFQVKELRGRECGNISERNEWRSRRVWWFEDR